MGFIGRAWWNAVSPTPECWTDAASSLVATRKWSRYLSTKDNKSLITFSARQTDLVRFGELQSQGFSAEVYVKRIYPQIIVYILLSSAGGNSSGRIPRFSSISSHFGYSAMQMDSIKVHLLVCFSPSYSQQILPSFATDQESGGNGHQYCRYKYWKPHDGIVPVGFAPHRYSSE